MKYDQENIIYSAKKLSKKKKQDSGKNSLQEYFSIEIFIREDYLFKKNLFTENIN